MQKWEEWIKILENNPKKSARELAKYFNKTHTWVHYLKTFYNAPAEEKEKLKDTHPQYAYFYKVWKKENNINVISITPEKENNKHAKNTFPRIPYYQIQDLKIVIMRLALLNNHLIKENNAFAEDNIAKACSINQLINVKNSLREKLQQKTTELKIITFFYYLTSLIALIIIITGIIKCSG